MFLRFATRVVVFFFVFLCIASQKSFAQPALPDLASVSQNGVNILTWSSPYDGLKSIAVQRSSDSNFNYITIGYVRDIKKGVQYYLDGHPAVGNNWYRVVVVFGSSLSWTSNRIKIKVDSAQMAKGRVLPSNDSLQGLASKFSTKTVKTDDTAGGKVGTKTFIINTTVSKKDSSTGTGILMPTIEIPDIESVNTYSYVRSQYVFTNPFTGHVNIEIADAKTEKYTIDFFDNKDVKMLEVPRIPEANVILDKRNFQRVGIFKFELYKNKQKIETGYISIY